MKIEPVSTFISSHKQGELRPIDRAEIAKVLGFDCNSVGDEYKVTMQWEFKVDGVECSIWDYKGSAQYAQQFSTFGPDKIFKALFGDKYHHDHN